MNAIAFKEWAAVCLALGTGRQTVILRKGGIHEGRDGFRVQHSEFWLLPTSFHQSADELQPDAHSLLARVQQTAPPQGAIWLSNYAVVQETLEVAREEQALALATEHIWSEFTVKQRFHYRRPGLFVLVVRIFEAPQPHVIRDTPAIAGCRSWVELPQPLSTVGLKPVLSDAEFQSKWERVRSILAT